MGSCRCAPAAESFRNLLTFFFSGLINNFGYVVMLSAADDLLDGKAPTAVVLLCDILPCLIIQSTAAFWMHLFPYWARILFVAITQLSCFQLVAWCDAVWLRLLGVVLASVSSGFGEVTFLALSSYFHKSTVTAWSSGTGGAGVVGSLSYLAFKSWFRLSQQVTLMAIGWVPLIIVICYFFVLQKPATLQTHSAKPPTVEYDALLSEAKAEEGTGVPTLSEAPGAPAALSDAPEPAAGAVPAKLSFVQRLRQMKHLAKFLIPLLLVYFSEYLINQGISPTIKFDGPIPRDDYYRYYATIYQVGVFFSRSSTSLFTIKHVWVPSVLQAANLVFFLFQAIYGFVPWFWVIFLLILWEGLLGGVTYVNVFYQMSLQVAPELREFSLGIGSSASATGITAAAVLGMWVEPWIQSLQK
ncbi:putative Protein btn-1 [Paratrimastix pyriformis]|uniref:Protein BTN n=1 Tax=Paratrimastix pyriformis TaxID=342808 RepID=A0ABQ8U6B4_9EUKA|nr:putative Protein btn-1 [Paratrimastix pyriformis]